MPRWRKATWALGAWNVFMLLWLATAIGGLGGLSCAGETGAALAVCEAGVSIGLTYGLSFILFVWLAGSIAFGLTWLTSRPRSVSR